MELTRSYWIILFSYVFIFPCNDAACTTSKDEMRWPLVPLICTQEIKRNTDPLPITPCSLTFVDDYPSLAPPSPPPSVRLQGGSVIDLSIPNFSGLGDFGFSVFVKPDSLQDSCIFHYKSDDNLFEAKFISTPTETRIVIDDGTSISVSRGPLLVGTWQKVGLGVDISTEKVRIYVDRFTFDDDDPGERSETPYTISGMRTPGTLRVGGSSDGENYSGLVSCVGFNKDKHLDCSTNCYGTAITSRVNAPLEKRHYGSFIPVMSGTDPVDPPIHVTSKESLNPCALLCLRNFFACATLTYDVITKVCSLYSGTVVIGDTQAGSPSSTLYTLQGY